MQEPTGGKSLPRTESVRAAVLRPDDGASIYIRSLADGPILGAWFHYTRKDGSKPCQGEECHCKGRRTGAIWKGYFAGEEWVPHASAWHPGAVEVTEHCALEMGALVRRGEVWLLTREPKKPGRSGKVTPHRVQAAAPAALRPAFDLRPILWHLFRAEVFLETPLHVPEKPMMAVAPGDAPPGLAPAAERTASPEEIQAKLRAAGIAPPPLPGSNGRKSGVRYT